MATMGVLLRRRLSMTKWLAATVTVVLIATAVTRFVPAIEVVEVSGHEHLRVSDVMRIARVAPGDPFLWTTRWRMSGLEAEPWVAAAWVEKRWPDTVSIRLRERTPFAWNGDADDPRVWARDGTILPGTVASTRDALPVTTGWGPDRLAEALEIADLLRSRRVALIEWHPEGFTVLVDGTTVTTPSVSALLDAWAAVDRGETGTTSVYPWGASVANE